MKNLTITIFLVALALTVFPQEKVKTIKLGLASSHEDNFEYLNGHVKEIHYKPFHLVEKNGEFVKGKPFTFQESGNTAIRQPISYYFNELGQLVKMSAIIDNGIKYVGVVHNENGNIENIYWLGNDTLSVNWDFVYTGKTKVERLWKMVQNDEVQGKLIYELDNNGNILKTVSFDKDDNVTYTSEYSRNPDGTLKSSNGIDKDGKIKWGYDKFTYNPKGLVESNHINIFNYDKSDQTTSKIEYKYDEKGNWIERKHPAWMVIEREIVYYDE
jgi:hypothetical protein